MAENNVENKPKEKKTLRGFLNSAGEVGSTLCNVLFPGVILGTALLMATFSGESIKVPKGSNLWEIAKQYGTTCERLVRRNKDIENPDYVQAGQDLIIYNDGASGFFQKIVDTFDKHYR